jgi:hypothetical protein
VEPSGVVFDVMNCACVGNGGNILQQQQINEAAQGIRWKGEIFLNQFILHIIVEQSLAILLMSLISKLNVFWPIYSYFPLATLM